MNQTITNLRLVPGREGLDAWFTPIPRSAQEIQAIRGALGCLTIGDERESEVVQGTSATVHLARDVSSVAAAAVLGAVPGVRLEM